MCLRSSGAWWRGVNHTRCRRAVRIGKGISGRSSTSRRVVAHRARDKHTQASGCSRLCPTFASSRPPVRPLRHRLLRCMIRKTVSMTMERERSSGQRSAGRLLEMELLHVDAVAAEDGPLEVGARLRKANERRRLLCPQAKKKPSARWARRVKRHPRRLLKI